MIKATKTDWVTAGGLTFEGFLTVERFMIYPAFDDDTVSRLVGLGILRTVDGEPFAGATKGHAVDCQTEDGNLRLFRFALTYGGLMSATGIKPASILGVS